MSDEILSLEIADDGVISLPKGKHSYKLAYICYRR